MHGNSNKIGLLFVVLVACIVNNNLFPQACCTGSTRITGAYRIASTAANKWNLSLIGDFNYIGDLYAFDTKLDNESLSRNTITLLLQTDYGLTERLSASVVIPYISKLNK